jgi:hypothetical protein
VLIAKLLDLLGFFFIELGDVVPGVAVNMEELIELGADSLSVPMLGALNK